MRALLKKTLLAGLPLAGLLAVAPAASAHDRGEEHAEIHRELGDLHDDFHQMPHSRRGHRHFHRELKREHRALDRALRDEWRYGDDRYGYGRRYDDDDSYDGGRYDRYGYGNRRYDDDDSGRYGYGSRPYYDGGYYPGSSSPLGPLGEIFLPR